MKRKIQNPYFLSPAHSERGSATIYLLICFIAVFLSIGVMVDLTRIKIAQYNTKQATVRGVRSTMAGYNPALHQRFDLFGSIRKETEKDYQNYVLKNLPDLLKSNVFAIQHENSNVSFGKPLSDLTILKQQILEETKYKAPVDFLKLLVDKFKKLNPARTALKKGQKIGQSFARVNTFLLQMHQNHSNITDLKKEIVNKVHKLQRTENSQERDKLSNQIKRNLRQISDELQSIRRLCLETSKELDKAETFLKSESTDVSSNSEPNGEALDQNIQSEINRYREILEKVRNEMEQSKNALQTLPRPDQIVSLDQIGVPSADKAHELYNRGTQFKNLGEYTSLLKEALVAIKDLAVMGFRVNADYPGAIELLKANESVDELNRHLTEASTENEKLLNLRDGIYIDHYVLNHFSNITSPTNGRGNPSENMEAEYICYGQDFYLQTLSKLYLMRLAFDSSAYFAFSKQPAEVLDRVMYSLVMGILQAAVDLQKLVVKKETVPVASFSPNNPLKDITLTYTDHFRLLMLLENDERGKLFRTAQLIRKKSGIQPSEMYTEITGVSKVSIKLFFLPSMGLGNLSNGPFGSQIINGRCYITKKSADQY